MALPERKASVQRLFNRLSAPYAQFVFSRLRAEIRDDVAWIQPRAREKVLDLACGPGTLALELSRFGCRVYAFDLAERMIARARQAARQRGSPRIWFAVADAEQLPLPDKMFDLVTCAFSLPGFVAPGKALAEIRRVTRPGGRIAILEAVGPEDRAASAERDRLERLRSDGVPAHLFSLPELLQLLQQREMSLVDASVSERRRRLEDWLRSAVVRGGAAAQRRLRQRLLDSAKNGAGGLRLERHRGQWFLNPRVARLLWRR